MSKDKKSKNPVKDKQVSNRVSRGVIWFNFALIARLSLRHSRDYPGHRRNRLGFRIVKNIPKEKKQ